jgi:hypothetical protein
MNCCCNSSGSIDAGKISTRGARGKLIRRLENGEFFRHRTHDELVQGCPILPRDLLNGALKGSWQSQSIVAACSHLHILISIGSQSIAAANKESGMLATFADCTLSGAPRLDALSFRQLGKFLDTIADFFACQPQFLQVKPEFRAGAKPVAEP